LRQPSIGILGRGLLLVIGYVDHTMWNFQMNTPILSSALVGEDLGGVKKGDSCTIALTE